MHFDSCNTFIRWNCVMSHGRRSSLPELYWSLLWSELLEAWEPKPYQWWHSMSATSLSKMLPRYLNLFLRYSATTNYAKQLCKAHRILVDSHLTFFQTLSFCRLIFLEWSVQLPSECQQILRDHRGSCYCRLHDHPRSESDHSQEAHVGHR